MSSDTFERLEMSFILDGMRCFVCLKPLENFGGCHPDPNLTYAKDLADLLLNGNQ